MALADWQSAIQQAGSLRYIIIGIAPVANFAGQSPHAPRATGIWGGAAVPTYQNEKSRTCVRLLVRSRPSAGRPV